MMKTKRILGWLLDFVPLLIVVGGFAYGESKGAFPRKVFDKDSTMLAILWIALATVSWFIFRLIPKVSSLAHLPRREELAVTFIPAREYLFNHLRLPIVRLLYSCMATCFLLSVIMVWMGYLEGKSVSFFYLCPLTIAVCLALAICRSFSFLNKLCRPKGSDIIPAQFSLLLWSILAVTVPIIVTWTIMEILNALDKSFWHSFADNAIMLIAMLAFASWCVSLSKKIWRDTVTGYYRFD